MATWFITFRTYGSWLHGDERGSVDDRQNGFGETFIPPNTNWLMHERELLRHEPMTFSPALRGIVDRAIRDVCTHRAWMLHELNVRSNHVHVIVSAPGKPERMLNDFKAWSTRRLREDGHVTPDGRVWARHGSTRLLTTEDSFADACRYVRLEQDGSNECPADDGREEEKAPPP